METVVINITTEYEKALEESAKFLKNGEVVSIPTETVYGLGADATNEKAVAKVINELSAKGAKVIFQDAHVSGHACQEELKLILKHEIVHIAREDSWSKFFLVFCTAMYWFNPLMWYAMKKSAEDMELSCDDAFVTVVGVLPEIAVGEKLTVRGN